MKGSAHCLGGMMTVPSGPFDWIEEIRRSTLCRYEVKAPVETCSPSTWGIGIKVIREAWYARVCACVHTNEFLAHHRL